MDAVAVQTIGRYTPVAVLGRGGMAEIFLAIARGPRGADKWAVLKRPRHTRDRIEREMFVDETALALRLHHPNVVLAYEGFEAEGHPFLAMEYLEGQPLNRVMSALSERRSGLSESLAAFIALQTLNGLHYVHDLRDFDGARLDVVHRDVSPHNIFVTYDGRVKVLDFGVAKASVNATETSSGMLKGKVRYLSPEQAAGKALDRRSDVFAAGVVLWEMLARRPLFDGPAASVLQRVKTEDVPPVRSARGEVSAGLDAILERALRRRRKERFATAGEMVIALERWLQGDSGAARERELALVMDELFCAVKVETRAKIAASVCVAESERRVKAGRGVPDLSRQGLPSRNEGGGTPSEPRTLWDGTTRS